MKSTVRLRNTWPCLHNSKLDSWVCGALVLLMFAKVVCISSLVWRERFRSEWGLTVLFMMGVQHAEVAEDQKAPLSGRAIKVSIQDKFLLRLEPHWVFLNPYPHRAGPKSSPISRFLPLCRRKLLTLDPGYVFWVHLKGEFASIQASHKTSPHS